ncbi:MAG: cache domain-containing protein [Methanoregula sp.]|nr:cache domain-containing protein [Methanoregula sp.]
MKTGFAALSLLLILCLLLLAAGCMQPAPATVTPSPATQSSSKEAMVAFVREAVAYAQSHDKNTSLAEFSNRNGTFVRGDLYLYAYDFNGTTIAHPVNPEKIGVNRLYEPDALGNFFIHDLRAAAINGSGFVEYYYINPSHNNAVEKKLGYVEKIDDTWWLGSGIYFGPSEPTVTPAGTAGPSTSRALKEYVDNAATYAQEHGREAALAAFNNRSGPFVTGDVYVYALDYSGNALALPFQPEQVGTSFLSLNDSAGKPYTQIEIQLAKSGGGYILYHYPDPAAGLTPKLKISYVRPVDDSYWIGAGIYTSEDRIVDPQLRQFVTDAQSYAREYGRDAAVHEFNNLNGSFTSKDLYIFANDYNGTVLAWPHRPDMIGVNHINTTDAVGTHHIQALLGTARNGSGMADYYSVNPVTNTTQLKISYVTDVDGTWMLGAGRYMEPGPVILSP